MRQQNDRKANIAKTTATAHRQIGHEWRWVATTLTGSSFVCRCACIDVGSVGSGGAAIIGRRERREVAIQAKTAAAIPAKIARAARPSLSPPPRIPKSNPVTVATLTRVSPAERGFISTLASRRGRFADKVGFFSVVELAERLGAQIKLGGVLIGANCQRRGVITVVQFLLDFRNSVLLHE